jgi:hypothetical protein
MPIAAESLGGAEGLPAAVASALATLHIKAAVTRQCRRKKLASVRCILVYAKTNTQYMQCPLDGLLFNNQCYLKNGSGEGYGESTRNKGTLQKL